MSLLTPLEANDPFLLVSDLQYLAQRLLKQTHNPFFMNEWTIEYLVHILSVSHQFCEHKFPVRGALKQDQKELKTQPDVKQGTHQCV